MNKLQKLVADYIKRNAAVTKKISDEIIARIKYNTTPEEAERIIREVFGRYGIVTDIKQTVQQGVVDSISLGVGKEIAGERAISIKRWYLEKAYKTKGKFSSDINKLDRVDEIVAEVQRSLKNGTSWRMAAQNLSDKNIQYADVAKDVDNILDMARKAYRLSDNTDGYKEYRKAVEKVQKRINTLTDQDTSKLRRAYQDILDITNESSAAQIENATKYSSYFKQRYNAERIIRTEFAKAYNDAAITDNLYDEDSIGLRWVLSSAHDIFDICNFHASANLYGMGPGCYPKDHAPTIPSHPNCQCMWEQIIERETIAATKKDYDPKAGEKYIKSLSAEKQKELLGKKGAERFKDKPSSWSKNLPNWEGHEDLKPTIPKKVLYGGKR